jgi:hypothetical protein
MRGAGRSCESGEHGKWREVGDDRWVQAVGERKKKKREKERGARDGLVCWAFAPGWPRLSFFLLQTFLFSVFGFFGV